MIATELGSISPAKHRLSRRCRPVLASNRLGQRRLGRWRASEGLDSGRLDVSAPLQVVAGRHQGHGEVRPRLADGANRLATERLDGREHVFDSGSRLGDAPVAPLLACRQWLVALAAPWNLVAEPVVPQPGFARLRRVASVRMDIPARVAGVEVLAVVGAGRVGLDRAAAYENTLI